MSVPSKPYCGTEDVAGLLINLAPSGNFSDSTTPTAYAVNVLIRQYGAMIDMSFARAGYVIPWQVAPGESWADWQTDLLSFMNALGVAGAISGPVLKPAPAQGTLRASTENQYVADYKDLIANIEKNGLGIRANYHPGSRAEEFVNYPKGPLTDDVLGIFDPTRWQLVGEYTALVERIRDTYSVRYGLMPLDHMAARRMELVGL